MNPNSFAILSDLDHENGDSGYTNTPLSMGNRKRPRTENPSNRGHSDSSNPIPSSIHNRAPNSIPQPIPNTQSSDSGVKKPNINFDPTKHQWLKLIIHQVLSVLNFPPSMRSIIDYGIDFVIQHLLPLLPTLLSNLSNQNGCQ